MASGEFPVAAALNIVRNGTERPSGRRDRAGQLAPLQDAHRVSGAVSVPSNPVGADSISTVYQ